MRKPSGQVHPRMQGSTRSRAHTQHVPTHSCFHTQTHKVVYIQTHPRTNGWTHVSTPTGAWTNSHTHISTNTDTHTHILAGIHTDIRTNGDTRGQVESTYTLHQTCWCCHTWHLATQPPHHSAPPPWQAGVMRCSHLSSDSDPTLSPLALPSDTPSHASLSPCHKRVV